MERRNKAELIGYIEEQNKALQKYKNRLHDVVESYKSLVKEKEALEESVKLLTEGNSSVQDGDAGQSESTTKDESEQDESRKDDVSSETFESLKTSLRILTTEKARIENELKADRKRLLKENEDLKEQLKNQKILLNEEKSKFDVTVKELRKQIRDQQKEREKEQQDHAVMLKELQSLVADERCAKEKFEQQVENLKLALEKLPDKRFEYEKRISELQSELVTMRDLLQAAEGEKKDLPSLLRQLQQEMYEMKERHQEAVEREYKRANEAEEKLKALAALSEERAASLEQRLCELSQMVGNYDKLRQQDQIAIQKLKERVAQLDQENSALANTVAGTEKYNFDDDDANLDTETIMERITKLKSYLHRAAHKSKRSLSMSGVLTDIQKEDDVFNVHAVCQKEREHLRAELEQCKQKLYVVQSMKNVCPLEVESNSEITSLRSDVKSLEEELETCRMQLKSMEEHYQKVIRNLENVISDTKASRAQELAVLQSEHQAKQHELEQQMQKQRERSLAVLEDKDKEVSQLKSLLQLQEKRQHSQVCELCQQSLERETSDENQLTELLSNSVTSSSKKKLMLHYTQEIARKDVEISNLRRCRIQAETALRELQQNILLKEENYQNEIDILKAQINRLQSTQKGVNMEYLKNVILRFVKCSDLNDQSHMINAIAAILHFTPKELQEVRASRQAWSWNVQRIT